MEDERYILLGKTPQELKVIVREAGLPPFTARQIEEWLYKRQVTSFDEMTNISKNGRIWLNEHASIGCSAPVETQRSHDGTVKYLFKTKKGDYIESVFIPTEERGTLCVSSQVGCKMGCKFCMTGRQGYSAQLTACDILNQIYSLPERDRLTNIVFMGQGEPMDNVEAVLRSIDVLTSSWGYGWSPKRITVSSVGVNRGLQRLLEETQVNVAISLHNAIPEERAKMMPAERAFGIEKVIGLLEKYEFCRKMKPGEFREGNHQRRLSFEYIVFENVNDSPKHIAALVGLVRRLDCRVNLIPFHPIPDSPLRGVSNDVMVYLRDSLTQKGVFTTIRASRGQDIWAACGLLSTLKQQQEKEISEEINQEKEDNQ